MRLASWWVGEQNVLGFEVPVDYAFGLQDPHGPCNLLQENPNSVLTQRALGCRRTRGKQRLISCKLTVVYQVYIVFLIRYSACEINYLYRIQGGGIVDR